MKFINSLKKFYELYLLILQERIRNKKNLFKEIIIKKLFDYITNLFNNNTF